MVFTFFEPDDLFWLPMNKRTKYRILPQRFQRNLNKWSNQNVRVRATPPHVCSHAGFITSQHTKDKWSSFQAPGRRQPGIGKSAGTKVEACLLIQPSDGRAIDVSMIYLDKCNHQGGSLNCCTSIFPMINCMVSFLFLFASFSSLLIPLIWYMLSMVSFETLVPFFFLRFDFVYCWLIPVVSKCFLLTSFCFVTFSFVVPLVSSWFPSVSLFFCWLLHHCCFLLFSCWFLFVPFCFPLIPPVVCP